MSISIAGEIAIQAEREEREACAKLVETWKLPTEGSGTKRRVVQERIERQNKVVEEIALAIRCRE